MNLYGCAVNDYLYLCSYSVIYQIHDDNSSFKYFVGNNNSLIQALIMIFLLQSQYSSVE